MCPHTTINKINLLTIKKNIDKYSPYPKKVSIIAVTKKRPHAAIISAFKNKIMIVGESQVQETIQKTQNKTKNKNQEIHLIGHLQSNKINKAICLYDVIQTIDTIKLCKKVNEAAKRKNKKQKVFFQTNISNAKTQKGFAEGTLCDAAAQASQLSHIALIGLMAIGSHTKQRNKIEKEFKKLKQQQQYIHKNINKDTRFLSIGMSGDYVLALQQGATHIRIGTLLYT